VLGRWILTGTAFCLAASETAHADVVLDWNDVVLESVRATSANPPMATRAFAMVHAAMFDAVNGVHRQYEPYLVRVPAPPGASPEAAASYAAHFVLKHLYPDRVEIFDAALDDALAGIRGPARHKGRAYGMLVGLRIVLKRRNDGAFDTVEYEPSGEIGRWAPTAPGFLPALLPNWPYVKTWAMSHGAQFRPAAPPVLSDEEYADAFDEVKELGAFDSPTRTADQSESALFWADGGGTVTPPGHWLQIGQIFADTFDTDLLENARLFALLALAQADAAICSWDAKYAYDHWRPVTGIQLADLDGNPDTAADPDWRSFIVTPPFPSYTSGHSTFSGAASTILALYFGSDDIAFTAGSPGLPGVFRPFDSLSEAAEEAGQSRIYGGIHWQYDNLEALEAGRNLAAHVFESVLQPLE